MSDILDLLGKQITKEEILKYLDPYSIITHYIGTELEPNVAYTSPLREKDENPSFSIFYGYGSRGDSDMVYFKDHVIGTGDVFLFVKLKLGLSTFQDVLNVIDEDFELGLRASGTAPVKRNESLIKIKPVIKERAKLEIISKNYESEKYKNYWASINVRKEIRDLYYFSDLDAYKVIRGKEVKCVSAYGLTIGYTIGKYHKVYCPFKDKGDKFKNDFPPNYIEGHMQIDWTRNDLLVITKSMKECAFFRANYNIQAVAGKSESTEIYPEFIEIYRKHFKRVVVWLDPDPAGEKNANKYISKYPWMEKITRPENVRGKDPTDIYLANSPEFTRNLVFSLLGL